MLLINLHVYMCIKSSLKYKNVHTTVFFISCKFEMNLFVSYTPNVLSKLLEIKAKAVLQELVLCVQHQD